MGIDYRIAYQIFEGQIEIKIMKIGVWGNF
jgi:hypothetical protein